MIIISFYIILFLSNLHDSTTLVATRVQCIVIYFNFFNYKMFAGLLKLALFPKKYAFSNPGLPLWCEIHRECFISCFRKLLSGAFSKKSHKNKFDSENKPIGSENIQKSPIVISFCLENSEIIFFSKSAVLGIMVFSKPLTPENRLVTPNGLKILGGPRPPWPPQFRHPWPA